MLQIPLESKAAQRERMDDIRRGRPAALIAPGASQQTAAAASEPQPEQQQQQQSAVPPGGQAASQTATTAGRNNNSSSGGGAAQPSAPGLPPPGPAAGAASGARMNAVAAALADRQHLFKLPDGLSANITGWRCFVGRSGRARLERTHREHLFTQGRAAGGAGALPGVQGGRQLCVCVRIWVCECACVRARACACVRVRALIVTVCVPPAPSISSAFKARAITICSSVPPRMHSRRMRPGRRFRQLHCSVNWWSAPGRPLRGPPCTVLPALAWHLRAQAAWR
jgi:hypothetical protein